MTSTFSFPDGAILGTADFPSQPWISTGGLEIDSGRLTGLGSASVGQGGPFAYDGVRLRFRTRFTDAGQVVAVAFNGARIDEIGVYVTLDSSGKISLSESDDVVGEQEMAPLETGVDWFVEAEFVGGAAEVTVSRRNYSSEPQAEVEASLYAMSLEASASGIKTLVDLGGTGALAPFVDELSIARCGEKPPSYETLFLDTFERPDSTTLGSAEVPASATWSPSSAGARIVDGALEVSTLAKASVALSSLAGDGLRIRTTLRTTAVDHWFDVNYNASAGGDDHPLLHPGFWIWGGAGATYTKVFFGNKPSETKHDSTVLTVGAAYFVELNRDDGSAVLTVRSGSFAGPVLVVEANDGLTAIENKGPVLRVGTSGSAANRFEDVRIDRYVLPEN